MGGDLPEKMKILFRPEFQYLPIIEGISKDISLLRDNFKGWVLSAPGSMGPDGWRNIWDMGRLRRKLNPKYYRFIIKAALGMDRCDIVHSFSWRLQYKNWMDKTEKPIIFTSSAISRGNINEQDLGVLERIKFLIVSNDEDKNYFISQGYNRVSVIRPAVKLFNISPPPAAPFTILMASAPWKSEHFSQKGIDILLRAAQEMPNIRWIFLWRGVYAGRMKRLISEAGLSDRIQLINRVVSIARVLEQVQAVVGIFRDANGVKSYPNSLLEALAAARPVIVTDNIPLADIVMRYECGRVCTPDLAGFISAIEKLQSSYNHYSSNCRIAVEECFSVEQYISEHQNIYHSIVSSS